MLSDYENLVLSTRKTYELSRRVPVFFWKNKPIVLIDFTPYVLRKLQLFIKAHDRNICETVNSVATFGSMLLYRFCFPRLLIFTLRENDTTQSDFNWYRVLKEIYFKILFFRFWLKRWMCWVKIHHFLIFGVNTSIRYLKTFRI